MTNTQVTYIVENILSDSMETITPLLSSHYITLTKFNNIYSDVNTIRVKFEANTEVDDGVLSLYHCTPTTLETDDIPADWVLYEDYDIIDGVVYRYLCDATGATLIDYFDFGSIILIQSR